jgi:DNA polymerase
MSSSRQILHIDFETKSDVDLKKSGAYVYAMHPSTDVLLASYALNDDPVNLWDATISDIPEDLHGMLNDPDIIILAANAQFERLILKHVLEYDYLSYERFRCTLVLSSALSFTGGLARVLAQAEVPYTKQADGQSLINLFCKPPHASPIEKPEQWERFKTYCIDDTVVSRALFHVLIKHRPHVDWEDYWLDQKINDAGVPIDQALIKRASQLSKMVKEALHLDLSVRTLLDNPNSRNQFLSYLGSQGINVDNVQKDTMKGLLNTDIDELVKDVIRDRMWLSRSSLAKWDAFDRVQVDGHISGMFQFLGAARTGRYAGRLVQLQNLPRPVIPNPIKSAEMLLTMPLKDFELVHPDTLGALSSMLRAAIYSGEDRRWVVADLGSIEGRVGGWLTGCDEVNHVFKQGLDQYVEFARHIFKVKREDVTPFQRFVSKPAVLGCQYRLGPKGLQEYAQTMGVDMTRKEARRNVDTFRELYPEIPQFWADIDEMIACCVNSGTPYTAYRCSISRTSQFLRIELPSGRALHYQHPKMEVRKIKYETDEGQIEYFEKECFTFMGNLDQHWFRISAHAGGILENIAQAIARDVLQVGLRRAHQAGLDIRIHVHDEIATLANSGDSESELKLLIDCMTNPIPWAGGLLLAADGYTSTRYKK